MRSLMIFGGKKKNWEDEYDEFYTQQDPEYDRRVQPLLWAHLGILATLAGVFMVIVGASAGFPMIEKVLKALIAPTGFVWLLLSLLFYFSLVYRVSWGAVAAFVCWLTLTIGGNYFVARGLSSLLESEYTAINPLESDTRYDVLIVLGGGTSTTPAGLSQLNASGDRVMLAARLYHAKKVGLLVPTGKQLFKIDEDTDFHPHEEAAEIFAGLSIPLKDIRQLGGNNTSEEMAQLKKWLDSDAESANWKVGILTSAWHLPRAMALAEANGIDAEPVPCDFLTQPYSPNPGVVVPSGNNLRITAKLLYEILGRMIGR